MAGLTLITKGILEEYPQIFFIKEIVGVLVEEQELTGTLVQEQELTGVIDEN